MGQPGSSQTASGSPLYDTATPPQVIGVKASVSASDTRYTVNGGASIALPSVSAKASATVSTYQSTSAKVAYSASATPVTIILTGATPDGNGGYSILVGQGCTASLNISLPTSNRKWTVSGTTFQDWEPTTPAFPDASPPTPANSQASYYLGGPGSLTKSTAHWYWNDASQKAETISFTGTVTPPAGQGSPFSVTATQNVTVYVPNVTKNANALGLGYVGPYETTTTPSLYAGPTPPMRNLMEEQGSTWTTSVALPPAPAFSGTGQWGYAQLVKPGEYITGDDGTTTIASTDTSTGLTGLDSSFPYMSSSHSTDGVKYNDGDDPGLDGLTDPIFIATLTDAFQTYLMFQPPVGSGAPANDVRWVPLAESVWDTNLKATRPNPGGWTKFPPTQSVGPVEFGKSGFDFKPQNKYPSWTNIFTKQPFIHQ